MESERAEQLIMGIPNPEDYYQGKGAAAFPLPEQLLFFNRTTVNMEGFGITTSFHYRYVLIINFGESLKLYVDGTILTIDTLRGILLLPYQYHRFINEGQDHIALAFMTFSMAQNAYFESLRDVVFTCDQQTIDLLATTAKLFCNREHHSLPFQGALLLSHIARNYELIPQDYHTRAGTNELIMRIIRAVYLHKSSTIASLSSSLGFSESYLRSYFKRRMGISLGRFIIEIRLTEAMKLLSHTDHSITRIAELCGYESLYTFSRSFKT